MTPNGRLEEVVEALLKRVEVLEEKAGIRNSNIIKNPKLMVVEDSVELTEEQAKNFTYGAEMVNGLIVPDWDLITEKKAEWIEKWNNLFSVQ